MRGIWAVVLATSACGFSARARDDGGGGNDSGSGTHDAAPVDAAPDAPPGQLCFGTLNLDRVCYPAASVPGGSRAYQGPFTLDLSNPAICTGNANAVAPLPGDPCIIAYGSITLTNAQLLIGGSRPVIFLATGAAGITVDAQSVINVSSILGGTGAGALASCEGTTAAMQKSGGFGGSFLVLGGTGGLGAGDQAADVGVPATVLGLPTVLHGGCPGGIGANNNFTTPNNGGGAVALVAPKVVLDGLVAAGGDGGYASNTNNAGGNGGGAGGMIMLDSPAISGSGELDAKGGGGGEGRGGNQPTSGAPGYYPANRFVESFGGATFNSTGGDGGNGGPRVVNIVMTVDTGGDGGVGTSAAGGGGGGGAAGLVTATSTIPGTITSAPAPQ